MENFSEHDCSWATPGWLELETIICKIFLLKQTLPSLCDILVHWPVFSNLLN